jgi:5'-nucleotidase
MIKPELTRARRALASIAAGALLAAPLAVIGGGGAGAATIAGARSLSDPLAVTFAQAPKSRTTDLHLLAWNDFHGNLEPGGLNLYGQYAGGAAYLAKLVADRQRLYGRNEATVMAGDAIGASPLANALFHEEPAIVVSNLMHVDFSSVGNHEFDKGRTELLRIQNGGCHPVDGCTGAPYALPGGGTTDVYPGADFRYLSANVLREDGRTLFPASGIKVFRSHGKAIRVGFIGEVLKDTPTIVTPSGVAGLTFTEEADAANKAVRALKRRGVTIPVLVIHQGGFQTSPATLNGCAGNLAGSPILDIASRLDPSIKVIISGHTHAEYRCTVTTNGVTRLITSASSFGRALSDITLTVDTRNGRLVAAGATNTVVANALTAPPVARVDDPSKADPTVAAVVKQYVDASAPLANRVIGRIQGDLTRSPSGVGETSLGDVIADAQLAATAPADAGGAQLAFMNPGGIRADLLVNSISSGGEAPGEVTYGEAFTVQPFGNSLVTKTMTGDQLRALLEQQFLGCGGQTSAKTLQVSATFRYEHSTATLPAAPTEAECAAMIGQMWVDGVPVEGATTYRVTMNSFLATGGDGFTVFNEGTDVLGGAQDIDALVDAFAAAEPGGIAVPPADRIVPIS